MRLDYNKYFITLFVLILLTCTLSCSGKSDKNSDIKVMPVKLANEEAVIKLIKIVSPEENSGFKLNDHIDVILSLEDPKRVPDSVVISFNGILITTLKSEPWEYTIPSSNTLTTGRKSLKVVAYKGGRQQNSVTRFMIIYSDVVPKTLGYRVVKSYPHDIHAFTQGLVYDNGVIFESTGQETSSSVREVEFETGKIIRQHNLDASLFGEGIALYKDRIYQVTYTSKVGFIYEKSTFRVINKIYYPTQGWGLTTIGDNIVMSDGTNVLYFYEPEMFTAVSRIEVYDNEIKVDSLNELEYINGEIWANIWLSDRIARIDPLSGKVIAYIDLKGLLPKGERNQDTDVLNGIAYDKENNRLFVTGKRWPKLFEIKITE